MNNILDNEIKFLPGVGPRRADLLAKELNIHTFRDMMYTFPFRYVDRSRFYAVRDIDGTGVYVQLRGVIRSVKEVGAARAKRLIATFSDDTGTVDLIFFKGIKWVSEKLKAGSEYVVFGKPSFYNGSYNFVHPEVDSIDAEMNRTSSMIGIYSSTEKLQNAGITNKVFSKLQMNLSKLCAGKIQETMPQYILKAKNLCPLPEALFNIHFPQNIHALYAAQRRLKYEELFLLQLSLLKQKCVRMRENEGVVFKKVGDNFNYTYDHLSFPLTGAQKRVLKEIRADVVSGKQMNRLLQGDVGSGKTLVAILSALQAIDNGYQACIMAPTEVLAQQHFGSVSKFVDTEKIRVALLTGSTKPKEKKEIYERLENGTIDLVIGTHALIEDKVRFSSLGLAVIDEQHRFGVEQRSRLWSKSRIVPHILVMTATPIPRTLAMTLYGDLDVSVIDELPPGRKPVVTTQVTESKRQAVYDFMRKEIDSGRQVFVVYPLIKESEKLDYENLEAGYDAIKEEFKAPQYIVAVVHGKQTNENKAHDMKLFAEGRAHILVATSVIEVGVDVPNASVMVIESAERFGLSQLHQLRGRVGRGAEKSYCILMTGNKLSSESKERIAMMCQTTDGFELAEADLKMRGPGDFEGTRQSGLAIDLHIANLVKDSPMLEEARKDAQAILDSDPELKNPENTLLVRSLQGVEVDFKDYSKIS